MGRHSEGMVTAEGTMRGKARLKINSNSKESCMDRKTAYGEGEEKGERSGELGNTSLEGRFLRKGAWLEN